MCIAAVDFRFCVRLTSDVSLTVLGGILNWKSPAHYRTIHLRPWANRLYKIQIRQASLVFAESITFVLTGPAPDSSKKVSPSCS